MKGIQIRKIQGRGVEEDCSFQAKSFAKAMPIHDSALTIFGNITVNLLLSFLSGELQCSTKEMLSIYPCTWNPIYSNVVEKKEVWRNDCSSLASLLLYLKIFLLSETDADRGEV